MGMYRTVLVALTLALATGGCFRSSNGSDTSASSRADAASQSATGGDGVVAEGVDGAARASDARRKFPLDTLPTSTVTIGENVFRVWLAREFDENGIGVVTEGLMHVPEEEIDDDQGMLFVFSDERQHGFWMRNTIAPLDIAFARSNGTIVKIWQMPPLTLRTFPSIEPAMFALEVKQGTFDRLGIRESDRMEFGAEVLAPRE